MNGTVGRWKIRRSRLLSVNMERKQSQQFFLDDLSHLQRQLGHCQEGPEGLRQTLPLPFVSVCRQSSCCGRIMVYFRSLKFHANISRWSQGGACRHPPPPARSSAVVCCQLKLFRVLGHSEFLDISAGILC
ncbi:hypothetical protein HJG60_009567 [Phyllostomus discolor]|uniref:Uncharacterized protein n=1 Tax=Phyllostomus discolor TaxID=89673 RepID=A0A833Y3I1_9CHIR|nr:hypothetical protein HJG60_009567 [Phyllostomus discolor]